MKKSLIAVSVTATLGFIPIIITSITAQGLDKTVGVGIVTIVILIVFALIGKLLSGSETSKDIIRGIYLGTGLILLIGFTVSQ